MLPSLTVRARRFDRRRIALAIASALLALAALASQSSGGASTAVAPSLAEELHPATWALFVPTTWLVAPAPRVRRGDLVDLLAVRSGDRGFAAPIAYGAAVVATDDRGFVLEVDENDASAIATARASGMQLVALLRSAR
jgi:hypothetical protein